MDSGGIRTVCNYGFSVSYYKETIDVGQGSYWGFKYE
jgi:hypothetical protein